MPSGVSSSLPSSDLMAKAGAVVNHSGFWACVE
jgi:hypothetical protein